MMSESLPVGTTTGGEVAPAGTEANAEHVLVSYLDELGGGMPASAFPSPQDGSQLVHIEETGKEFEREQCGLMPLQAALLLEAPGRS